MGDETREHDELEKYGVWVKAGPEEVVAADDADEFDLSDLPTDDDFADDSIDPLSDLDAVDAIPTESTESIDDVSDLDISELDVDDDMVTLDDLDLEEPEIDPDPFESLEVDDELIDEVEPTVPEEVDEVEHDFTPDEQGIEIASGESTILTSEEEEFLSEDLQIPEESDTQKGMDPQERSAFAKIQEELEDIKTELAQLRQQLAGAPVQAVEPPDVMEEIDLDESESGEEASHGTGFFDDDEDETIALTGDELDNILNTAEFTEETGEAEELEDDLVVDAVESDGLEGITLGDTDEFSIDDADELTLDDTDELAIDDVDELTLDDTDELAIDDVDELTLDDTEELAIDDVDELTLEDGDDSLAIEEESDDTPDIDSFGAEEKERQLDELAEMDIDEELADIDELVDDTETDNLDEIELDLDDLGDDLEEDTDTEDDVEELDLLGTEETLEIDTGEEQEPDGIEDLEVNVDDLEEDFDSFADEVEKDIAGDEAVETFDADMPDIESIDLEAEEEVVETPEPVVAQPTSIGELPDNIKDEIRSVLSYMDQLLEALPDEKIQEFAQSEHFGVYKRLFEELGLEN